MTKMDKPENIDGPKQWASTNGRIMLWPPEKESGAYNNPADCKIEGQVHDYAFQLIKTNYVVIRDFHFVATTIKFQNCKYCTIENCCFSEYRPER